KWWRTHQPVRTRCYQSPTISHLHHTQRGCFHLSMLCNCTYSELHYSKPVELCESAIC
ncbi:hypothetical protein NDU88_001829, partial [Pleurodeles waltl]